VKQIIWWHGTTSARKARAILRDGFRKGTYFARHLEDALEFGGRHVFTVQFTVQFKPGHRGWRRWQVALSNALPADAIVNYEVYSIRHVAGQPTGGKRELVDIEAEVRGETDKAIRLHDGIRTDWFPKYLVEDNRDGTFTIPVWLAQERGFI
jgi:hypothetical protein